MNEQRCARCRKVIYPIRNATLYCNTCARESHRQSMRDYNEAIANGWAHSGSHTTPVPQATLDKIERMRREESEAVENARIAVSVPFCDDEEGEYVNMVRRDKVGLKPAITCPCGRTVVPGTGYCWRHSEGERK